MPRKAITSPKAKSIGPYSHAVDTEGLVYVSGQAGLDVPSGKLVEGGVGEQTRQTFVNLFNVLEAGGLGPDDVQKVNVYLTDMGNFQAMNEVYQEQFKAPYPARTTVAVAALPLDALVEIEIIARRPR